MASLTLQRLNDYRRETYHLDSNNLIRSKEQAIDFVNERGFVFFWPIRGITLPSLWAAAAGDRPVPNEHDDPGHVTWSWKDELLDKRVWYYAKFLRRRNTFISHDLLPYFYALSPNYGDPDEDYLFQYEQGLMTQESKLVYEALLKEGKLDTISLRKIARLSNPGSDTRFNRALDTLQIEFKVLPTGIAEAGAWRYAYYYDLTHRIYPYLIGQAGPISEFAARRQILTTYFHSVGAASRRDATKLLGWRPEDLDRALSALITNGVISEPIELEGSTEPVFTLRELL